MSTGPRRLAAIMFTDLVGFTRLGQRDEEEALRLRKEHQTLVRPLFERHGGREVKSLGDGFLVEFPSAVESVRCAVEIQEAVAQRNSLPGSKGRIVLRIGVHVGDVVGEGDDIVGDAVNIASRIEPLAAPGGICVSGPVFDQVRNKLHLPLEKLASPRLKNVEFPLDIYRVVLSGDAVHPPVQAAESGLNLRLAVLPFANLSSDVNDEYFADGMTEEIISTIAAISGLKVISRTSAMKYKNTERTLPEIGRELNVGSVVEGSVRKAGGKVRISVQLVDARTDEHLWANQYDRELKDIFAIQAEIATQTAASLKVTLLPAEARRIATKPSVDPEVHALYLRGRFYANKRTEQGLNKSIDYFHQALERDPTYARAYAGVADAYIPLGYYCYLAPSVAMPRARAAAEAALQVDPILAEAKACLGAVKWLYEWDHAGAEKEFRSALRTDPGYTRGQQLLAELLIALGRFDEARSELKQALDIDPLSLSVNLAEVQRLYLARQYDAAIDQSLKQSEMDPNYFPAHLFRGMVLGQQHRFSEAIGELEAARTLSNGSGWAVATLGEVYALAGERGRAEALLRELEGRSMREYISQLLVAGIFVGLGDPDRAIACLERAVADRDPNLIRLGFDPYFDGLRSDSRFQDALRRVGLGR